VGFAVGDNTAPGRGAEPTIQAAITDAAAKGTAEAPAIVTIYPGEYEEDLTLEPNVIIQAAGGRGTVTITGSHTYSPAAGGVCAIVDIDMEQAGAGNLLSASGALSTLVLLGCRLDKDGSGGFTLDVADEATVAVEESELLAGVGDAGVLHQDLGGGVGGGTTVVRSTLTAAAPAAPAAALDRGEIDVEFSIVQGVCTVAPPGAEGPKLVLRFTKMFVTTGATPNVTLTAGGGGAFLELEHVSAINLSGDWLAGTGTAKLNAVSTIEGASIAAGVTASSESDQYVAAAAGDWDGTAPDTVKEALDRIAAAVGPVPV